MQFTAYLLVVFFFNTVVQFAPTKSLLCCSVPGGCLLWLSVHLLLEYRVQSYRVFAAFALATLSPGQTYTGPNETVADGDLCNCNTVLYSVISACAACQQGGWPPCVEWLCLGLYSEQST